MSAVTAPIQLKEGEELFRLLSVAVSDYRIFSAKHPRFLDSCQNFLTALEDFFAAHPDPDAIRKRIPPALEAQLREGPIAEAMALHVDW